MLSRLRITQRLSLLLVLPLAAVILTSVPFTVERVDDARAAAAIVDSATDARVVGAVIQDLQQERLLAVAYLVSSRLSRSAVVAQMNSVRDLSAQAGRTLSGSAATALADALDRLDTLDDLRRAVLVRTASITGTFRAYNDAILSLVDGLRLVDQLDADATGLRQMASLDALLRTNEEANRIGVAIVVAAVDPLAARALVTAAAPIAAVNVERFRQLGAAEHVSLLDLSAEGPSARRANALAATLTRSDTPTAISVDNGLSVAETGIAVRRGLQDQIVSDIASRADRRATESETAAVVVAGFAIALLAAVIWLGAAVSRSVARPLRRVTVAAATVADLASRELIRVTDAESDDQTPPKLAAVTLRTADEIGELASAFNRVQATAALMMEQQVTTRRNVAVMFANIAHRTRSLVARQLAHIDSLERDERDEQRLGQLYRLDHLTTRLRRSADSLLVIAGARDQAQMASPTLLVDVIRSAIAEIEGYQQVRLGHISDITVVATVVPDLTLLLAELLENATAFSPPEVPVDVAASVQTGCLIQIVDRGIGMSTERLAEENKRLVTRERLDVAPTTMLGLFVVGRLARRHDITTRLQPTHPTGVTAEVILPLELLLWAGPGRTEVTGWPSNPAEPDWGGADRGAAHRIALGRAASVDDLAPAGRLATTGDSRFTWFDGHAGRHAAAIAHPNGRSAVTSDQIRGGLRRRQPGTHLTDIDATPTQRPATAPASRDPELERANLDAFAEGTARASRASLEPASDQRQAGPGGVRNDNTNPGRDGLQRRRPGAHLAETLRDEPPGRHARREARSTSDRAAARDPEAERASINGYLDGLARAADPNQSPRNTFRS